MKTPSSAEGTPQLLLGSLPAKPYRKEAYQQQQTDHSVPYFLLLKALHLAPTLAQNLGEVSLVEQGPMLAADPHTLPEAAKAQNPLRHYASFLRFLKHTPSLTLTVPIPFAAPHPGVEHPT
ncbi:hypothetical protein AA106556_0938 [Neokomagataea tanensis NBRC 106556]|uniref:Uncharacterized protein n=1 Tax=Neokomagataea tanensis NBRC 106556 TaxID=1223519 RepID=A0ABQ0QIF7_9PROT|nr:hypothetical protein AA106556_0938 [Neokomagataea tanensis NBRC 106556]